MKSITPTIGGGLSTYQPTLIEEALLGLQGRARPSPHRRRSTADVYHKAWIDFGSFLLVEAGELAADDWAARSHTAWADQALHHLSKSIGQVNLQTIERYRAALLTVPVRVGKRRQVGLSASTVNRHLAAIRYLFGVAIRRQEAVSDPTQHVPRRKVRSAARRVLSPTQIVSMMEACPGTPRGVRNRALIGFLALSGARREEAATLRVEDLEWTGGELTIGLIRKGGERQRLLASGELAELMRDYLLILRPAGPVFPTLTTDGEVTGMPLSPDRITKIVREVSLAALGFAASPHSLRHAFVTTALLAGAALQDVQQYVGHADPSTTMGYYHATLDREHSAAEFVSLKGKESK